MKTPFLFFLLLSITILTGTDSCRKYTLPSPDNPYGLPNATQTGAETFACLVNGNPWIANHRSMMNITGRVSEGGIAVGGALATNYVIDFFILGVNLPLNKIQKNVPYNLSDTSLCYATMNGLGDSCLNAAAVLATQGELTITKLDTVNRIFSGTFRFDIPSDHCDTMKITDGRFDVIY